MSETDIKYILLLSRDLSKGEKDELKKFFCVFTYASNKLNNRTINELLNDYDVVCLNMYNSDDKQFYAQSIKLLDLNKMALKVFVGKLDIDEDIKAITEAYKIDYFVKKIPIDCDSKDEILHKIMSSLLPKLKSKPWKQWIWDGVVKVVSFLLPKIF